MPITKSKAVRYTTSDGQEHVSLMAAQSHEIELITKDLSSATGPLTARQIADFIVANSGKIADILTTKSNSRAERRKVNGAVRKSRTRVTAPVVMADPSKQ